MNYQLIMYAIINSGTERSKINNRKQWRCKSKDVKVIIKNVKGTKLLMKERKW